MSSSKSKRSYFSGSDLKTILHSKRANIYYLEHCRVMQKDGRVLYLTETDKENLYRVYRQCEHNPTEQVFFHLPPAMEYFYKLNHPDYNAIPPVRADCLGDDISTKKQVKFIYPPAGVDVLLPVDLDGVQNPIVLLATHSNPQASLYWYMDGKYLGQTSGEHQMACVPDPGKHVFWITDEFGNEDGIQVHAVLHNQRK